MSYNVSNFSVKEISLKFPPNFLDLIRLEGDWDYFKIELGLDKKWSCNEGGEGLVMNGVIDDDGWYIVEELECYGEGSGNDYSLLEAILKNSKGTLKAITTWEGGDSINKLIVEDGEITDTDLDI